MAAMAEEKKPDQESSGRSRRRKGRRRYFRRRKAGEEPQSDDKKKSQSSSGARSNKKKSNERARSDRRRRRRRSRSQKNKANNGPSIIEEIKQSYTPPESVFIYTHVNRIDQRDSGYEYRPEHFNNTGRTTADFRIDLTSLSDDILDPNAAPEEGQEEMRQLAAERPAAAPVDIFRDFESDYAGGYDDELPVDNQNDA